MAADNQIIVDIEVKDQSVKDADKAIDNLTDSIEELGNRISTARKQNKEFKKEQDALNKSYEEGTIDLDNYEKGVDNLNKKIKVNNKIIAEESQELSKLKRERSANIKLIQSEAKSLTQLEAKASLLNQAISKQETATKEGRIEYEKLRKELKKTNAEINEQRQSFNDNTRNIGNYKNSLEGLRDVQPQVVGGIEGIGMAFKALLKNPIVLLIASIVGGLKLLFDAFKRSASGSKILGKAMAGIKGIFAIITKAADKLGDVLVKVWDDPKKAVKDFGDSLEENLGKRMEGLKQTFSNIGAQIKSQWSGDTDAMLEAVKKTEQGFNQAMTGMTGKEYKNFVKEQEAMKRRAAEIAQSFIDLENAQKANRGTVRILEKQIASLNKEFEMLGEIAGDDTQNMQDMEQAAIDAGIAAEKLANKQVSLAQVRYNLITQEVNTRRAAGENIQDILDEQAQAEVELTDARSQAALAQKKILIEQRKIQRDIFEQNLDILIDVGDKIKTEQEKAIANDNLTLMKRREMLEALKVATAANFSEIKKEYELYGVTAEQINDVINSSDAKQTNEKLKALGLNEIAVNRLREIILERKQAELDFADISKTLDNEEIKRKEKAGQTISETNKKITLNQIEDSEQLKDKLIQFEKERLAKSLDNENLLAEEKEALRIKSSLKIQEIENNFDSKSVESQSERLEKRKELFETFFSELTEISGEFAGEQVAIYARIGTAITESFEGGKITIESALSGLQIASDAVFANIAAKNQEQFDNSEAQRQSELDLVGDNEEAKLKINEKFDKEQAKLKLKQFNTDKQKALTDIAIQTAIAVTKAIAASPVTGGLPFSAIVAALGLVQAGVVAKQKPPKFGGGTSDIVSIGDSHASGNDVDVWGYSGNDKQYFGKVEKGEAMPVIRKSAVNDYMVAKLNGQFSSQNRIFENGTTDITSGANQVQTTDNKAMIGSFIEAIKQVNIVAKIEDITKEANKKIEIVSNSKV